MDQYRKALTEWYYHAKRELPWRESRDPYHLWVSEVILQQTRVRQGIEYYLNFVKQYPDIKTLAMAPEEEVLKVWQGLGYYSRARNMHHAAKTILTEHHGKFPDDYLSIRNLKGIGDYTAAAIASIAFDFPYAVVDGNVFRVLSRLFGISTPIDAANGKKEFYKIAQMMLDINQPGVFNQALMEFGAMVCIPAQPLCSGCPLSLRCHAFTNQSIGSFPVKAKKPKPKDRYFNYLYLHQDNLLFLEKRGDKDIWRNMYQFPLIETALPSPPEEVLSSDAWKDILRNIKYSIESIYPEKLHNLTHQRLHIRFFSVRLVESRIPDQWIPAIRSEVARYPVPKPIDVFLMETGQ